MTWRRSFMPLALQQVHRTRSGLRGSKMLKAEPCPISVSTQMRPPCASTSVLTMDRPTPVSPMPWMSTLSARYRREKTRGMSSGGMPPPWSVTCSSR